MKAKRTEIEIAQEEVCVRLEWVRPVFKMMQDIAIPDEVAQRTMTFLLDQLDREFSNGYTQTRH